MLNYHLTTSKLINCYYTKLRPFFIPLFSIILILSLLLSTSFIIFHLLCHVHPPLSFFFVILPSFFFLCRHYLLSSSSFFNPSFFVILPSFLSSSFPLPTLVIFILPCHRILLSSSFLSLRYLHPYRPYRPSSFLYHFVYFLFIHPSPPLSTPLRFLFINFCPIFFEDEHKDRGGVGSRRMAKKR